MYIPKHFSITDEEEIRRFIGNNSFGELISGAGGELDSTHMPFLLSADNSTLLGHMAKANPHWQQLRQRQVLVSLWGPHGYISPSWYSRPGVPTWDYQAVHIYGTANSFDDPDRLKAVVDSLTRFHESDFKTQWQPDYASDKLRGIVGIEIKIQKVQCKYKLNQERTDEERAEVASQLEKLDNKRLAIAISREKGRIKDLASNKENPK